MPMPASAPFASFIFEVMTGSLQGARTPLGLDVCLVGNDDAADFLVTPPAADGDAPVLMAMRADAGGVTLSELETGGHAAGALHEGRLKERVPLGEPFAVAGVLCRVIAVGEPAPAAGSPDDLAPLRSGAANGRPAQDGVCDADADWVGAGELPLESDYPGEAARFDAALQAAACPEDVRPMSEPWQEEKPLSSPGVLKTGRWTRRRWLRLAVSAALGIALMVGFIISDAPSYAMQSWSLKKDADVLSSSNAPPGHSEQLQQHTVAKANALLHRAGLETWSSVMAQPASPGSAEPLRLHVWLFAETASQLHLLRAKLAAIDAPGHDKEGGAAFAGAVLTVMSGADAAAQVNGWLAGQAGAGPDLRALATGPGRVRLAGRVAHGADALAVQQAAQRQFPFLKAIDCMLAPARDACEALEQYPVPIAGNDKAGNSGVRPVCPPGDFAVVEAAGFDAAAAGRYLADTAIAQNRVFALDIRAPQRLSIEMGPAPKMIVMGQRPYAVLGSGEMLFEGDHFLGRLVSRIDTGGVQLMPLS